MTAYSCVRHTALVTLLLTLASCGQQAAPPPHQSPVTSQDLGVTHSTLIPLKNVLFRDYTDYQPDMTTGPGGTVYISGQSYDPAQKSNTKGLLMKLTPNGQVFSTGHLGLQPHQEREKDG